MFRPLIVAVVLQGVALAAEPATPGATTSGLNVGIAAHDITPPIGYPLSGYYYERGATGVLDPLHAKAIVLDDGAAKAAIVVCDLIGISTDLCQLVRERAAKTTGIPSQNIMIAATHSHTAPDYYADFRRYLAGGETQATDQAGYPQRLTAGIVSAIEEAADAASPASISVGSGFEDSISFNRRFIMNDGSIRTWANYQDPRVVRAAGPIDPALDVLLIQDPAKRELRGALSVFALHLDTTGGSQFSADFPFHLERALRTRLGPEFTSVFAAGTCGDINHVNPRSKDRNQPHVIGSRLGQAFASALDSMRDVSPSLRVRQRTVNVPMKTFSPEELAWARSVIAQDKAGDKLPFLDEVKAYNTRLLSLLRDGPSPHGEAGLADDANDGGQNWGTAASLVGVGESLPVEVQVIQLGDAAAIVALPGEVFVELGLTIKQASPYQHTVVVELANSDESGYVPTRLAYQGGGYEVLNSVFLPGGGELLVEAAVALLREMKAEEQPLRE